MRGLDKIMGLSLLAGIKSRCGLTRRLLENPVSHAMSADKLPMIAYVSYGELTNHVHSAALRLRRVGAWQAARKGGESVHYRRCYSRGRSYRES